MLFVQLDFVTTRSRLLQRALSRLYAALAFFVGTSVSIGLVAITSSAFTLVPIVLGLTGAGLLLYAAFLLIKESRFALAGVIMADKTEIASGKLVIVTAPKVPVTAGLHPLDCPKES